MSMTKARELIVDAIGDEWLADVLEVEKDGKKAYIAQLNASVCLGTPIVAVEDGGGTRLASVNEARELVAWADERDMLDPNLYR